MDLKLVGEPESESDLLARALELRDWMIGEARFIDDPDVAIEGLAQRLTEAGVPVDRIASAIPTLHAIRRGLGRIWNRDAGVELLEFAWGNQGAYESSPYYRAHQSRDWVAFRLDEVGDDAFSIVPDLRAQGFTHYLCMPIFFTDGTEGGMTFATRHPGGFSTANLALLRKIETAIAILLDLKRAWLLLDETLRMYVGEEPHSQILSGQVRRGEVLPIRSVIIFADMRGFTALTSKMTAEETVALLNRYFDCVVPPIEELGGQVLKYLGDGVLAIFRDDDNESAACVSALEATGRILERVREDRARAPEHARFDIKIALHHGEAAYGNIGSGARLDYTVVGADVDPASRLADLAGNLDRHVLVSSAFAALLPGHSFQPAGEYRLRGVAAPQTVYEPGLDRR